VTIDAETHQSEEAAMAVERKDVNDREEAYRDYEERDRDEGWPYADADGASGRKRNAAYGQGNADLDTEANAGLEVAGQTAIRSEGGPSLARAIAHGAIDDDGLEEAAYEALSADGRIDESQITVTVHGGVAEMEGSVETREQRAIAEQIIESIPGISAAQNRLVLSGLDGHIPLDASE
jgi:osmotically-inducible protein OsmY